MPHIVGRNTAKTTIGETDEEDMVKSSTKSILEESSLPILVSFLKCMMQANSLLIPAEKIEKQNQKMLQ